MTHLVCKMLAFTIQFPNNNPTPPHNQPLKQGTSVQQTQDKHRNTKPQPQPPTQEQSQSGGLLPQNPTVHQT